SYQDGTGMYHMGSRYYDPTTGRFTQQDPVTNPLDPSSWNRYAYSGDDPINFGDPTGLKGCGWEFWNCPKTIADAASSAWDWGFCVGKHMLPVNPDDVLALYKA